MDGGSGINSYAANSKLQNKAITKMKPFVEAAFGELCRDLVPKKMVMADLGCSSGPNTFMVISEVIHIIRAACQTLGPKPPEMQFFLNDLPGNDFNNIFRLLEYFNNEESLRDANVPYYIAGLPGSFYGRLFPQQSVHFFHSSYSLNWISQVPEGLENKGSIYISKTSPPQVVKLYQEQFRKDFSLFLALRFEELVSGGQAVLGFIGRKNKDILCGELSCLHSLVAEALNSMVLEGLVEEEKLYSFNLPVYVPSMEEVETIVTEQGLFDTLQIKMFKSNWDPDDDSESDIVRDNIKSGANFALCLRAVLEPMISSHFGEFIIEDLFSRFAINVANHLLKENTKLPILVLALKKKD
ncbi:hypothetical protein LUZ60_008272 [Juncus effusus]|nr:hypothetical protein LUZ60_008272 [Juncus effusus]